MARAPYAARTLHRAVLDHKPKATMEEFGDPDGLGVYRTYRFDKRTSKWLAPLIEQMNDRRITEANLTEAGYLHITFASGPMADFKDKFPLDAAIAVAARAEEVARASGQQPSTDSEG